MEVDTYCARLKTILLSDSLDDVRLQEYEAMLDDFADANDPSIIRPLLMVLTDNDDYEDMQFRIVHIVESYPIHTYVKSLLDAFVVLSSGAPHWAAYLLVRVLNSPEGLRHLQTLLKQPQVIHAALLQHLDVIAEEVPDLQAKCEQVKAIVTLGLSRSS